MPCQTKLLLHALLIPTKHGTDGKRKDGERWEGEDVRKGRKGEECMEGKDVMVVMKIFTRSGRGGCDEGKKRERAHGREGYSGCTEDFY